MKKFKSHEITVKGTLGVTAINVKTVEDVEKAVQQIAPANYSEVSTKDGEYGIIEIHETENGEYRYILTYNGENPYDATILDEYNKIIGYVQITDEEIDEVAENYKKAQKKVEVIGGRFYTKKDVVKSRKVNCTLGRSVYKDVHFTERVEISKEEAEEILKNYGFTAESYIAYKNGDRTEEKAEVEVEEYAVSEAAQEVATQAEIENASQNKEYTVRYYLNVTAANGWKDSEEHEEKADSHEAARKIAKQAMTKENFEMATIETANGFKSYHVYKTEEASEVTVANFAAEVEKLVCKIEDSKALGEHVTVKELEKKLSEVWGNYEQKLVCTTLAMEYEEFDKLFEDTVEGVKNARENAEVEKIKNSREYKEAEKFIGEHDLAAIESKLEKHSDVGGVEFAVTALKRLNAALAENNYAGIAEYGCQLIDWLETLDEKIAEVKTVTAEDDGSNNDPDEDFLATIDTSIDEDGDDDELVDEPEVGKPRTLKELRAQAEMEWERLNGELRSLEKEWEKLRRNQRRCKDKAKIAAYNVKINALNKLGKAKAQAVLAANRAWLAMLRSTDEEVDAAKKARANRIAEQKAAGIKYVATVYIFPRGHEDDEMDAYSKDCKTLEEVQSFIDSDIEHPYNGGVYDAGFIVWDLEGNLIADQTTGLEKLMEVNVTDYAVTPEAFEVAVQTEIDNAVAEANLAPQMDLQLANSYYDNYDPAMEPVPEEPEKIFAAYVSRFDGLSYHRKGEKFFNNATDAFNYLAKKKYKNDNWELVVESWDSEEDYYKYSGYGAFEEEHKIYTNSPDFDEYSTNAEIQKLIEERDAKAEVESTEVVKDDEKDFLDLLESTLETADSAVEKTVEEVIEYKPKLADKPYTCVTKRVGDFFNPKKFFNTLNDAVRYALVDKSKRMDWDERYNGAAVCLVYENGRCRPIWEITAEGNFETLDASECADIDTDQSVNIEKDIVETLNEIKYCNQDIERAKSRMENAKYWGKTEDVSIAEKDLLKEEKAKAKELSKLVEFSTAYPKIYAKAIKAEKEKYGAYFNRTYSGIATIES